MFLFKVVVSKRRQPGGEAFDRQESLGFPTRETAAGFARGLAESGRCDSVEIAQYIDTTDDEPRYTSAQVLEAFEKAADMPVEHGDKPFDAMCRNLLAVLAGVK